MFRGRFVYFGLPLVDVHFVVWEQASYHVLIGCLFFKGNDSQCPSFSCAYEQASTTQHGLTELKFISAQLPYNTRRCAKEETCTPTPSPCVSELSVGRQHSPENPLRTYRPTGQWPGEGNEYQALKCQHSSVWTHGNYGRVTIKWFLCSGALIISFLCTIDGWFESWILSRVFAEENETQSSSTSHISHCCCPRNSSSRRKRTRFVSVHICAFHDHSLGLLCPFFYHTFRLFHRWVEKNMSAFVWCFVMWPQRQRQVFSDFAAGAWLNFYFDSCST